MQKEKLIIEKPWGLAEQIFRNSIVEVWRCEINAGGMSTYGAFHRHTMKYNIFYLESGILDLYIAKVTGEIQCIRLTGDNPYYDVFPKVRHRFHAIEECILYEIYWVRCDPKDKKDDQ